MSDRPCNLVEFRRLVKRYGAEHIRRGQNEYGWTEVFVDGKKVVSYVSLPDEAHCGAYGGDCKC